MALLKLRQELEALAPSKPREGLLGLASSLFGKGRFYGDYYEHYVRERLRQIREAKEKLKQLAEVAYDLPASPMNSGKYLVLVRRGDKTYLRAPPRKPPTPPKLKTWELMAKLTKLASSLTYEEVAELVGGEVVDVGKYLRNPKLRGKKAVLVDGQLLTKAQAIMKLVKGKKFAIPKTTEERLLELFRKAGIPV